jgi:hypothetical protein
LLSGGTPQANFKHFCHAWGRDATFVSRLSNFICERRGDSDRKKIRTTDVTTAIDKRNLKKTGVIIPRTTPLEIYRSGIADTFTPSADIVEPAAAIIVEQTVDTTVDEVDIDVIHTANSSNTDNREVLDTMLGHESEPFLLMDESTDDTNPHDHSDMAAV